MTNTQEGDRVTIEMTRDDYDTLLIILGAGLSAIYSKEGDNRTYNSWLRFINELNNGNPNFTPYEIPSE
jgi:NADPH-dependent glutamate synthase beta subunit-like oxidoreductase